MESCGQRFNLYSAFSTAHFQELSISATFPTPVTEAALQATDSFNYPLALKTSIMPLEPQDYIYEVNNQGSITVYNLKLVNLDEELYSFAVWGRVFATDGQEADPPVNELEAGAPTAAPSDPITIDALPTDVPVEGGSTDSAVNSVLSRILLVPALLVFGRF